MKLLGTWPSSCFFRAARYVAFTSAGVRLNTSSDTSVAGLSGSSTCANAAHQSCAVLPLKPLLLLLLKRAVVPLRTPNTEQGTDGDVDDLHGGCKP